METKNNTPKDSKFKLVELEDVKDVLGGAAGANAELGSAKLAPKDTTGCAW